MNSKFKYHQSAKVEKENANVKLRKKTKGLTADKHKRETVWDRLSKIKKVSSSEKVSEEENIRSRFVAKSRQRFQPTDHTSLKRPKQTSKKQLVPANNSVNKHLNNIPQNTLSKKPKNICQSSNEEINTGRSLSSDSKCSSESAVDIFKFPKCCSYQRKQEVSEASIDEYTLASCSEGGPQNNFDKYFHCNNKSANCGDNDLVIDVAKPDNRDKDRPKLLKDIRQTRLERALNHELNIEGLRERFPVLTNKMIEYSNRKKEIEKFQVDVSFKSAPSLDNEIEILRVLGEKLEVTLKSSNIHRNRQTSITQIPPAKATNKPSKVSGTRNTLLPLRVKHDFIIEHLALVSVQLSGIRQCVGIINEFFVAKKSIVELKREPSRQFFISGDGDNIQLMKTSFKNLKQNPSELLRQVKSKNSQIAFNVLEQDPIFFYSALSKALKTSSFPLKNHNKNNEQRGATFIGTAPNDEESHCDRNCLIEKYEANINYKSEKKSNNNLIETQAIWEPLIRGKKRRRIRHLSTPMPIGYYHCPKNSVIKTILVAFVQVSLFIVFIAALTHPSLRCLDSSVYQ